MKRLLAFFLLFIGLLVGAAAPAQAQRCFHGRHGFYGGRGYRGRPVPRAYYRGPAPRPYYRPRYYHAAPYRYYGNRYYYRPRPYYRPGPAIIIRP